MKLLFLLIISTFIVINHTLAKSEDSAAIVKNIEKFHQLFYQDSLTAKEIIDRAIQSAKKSDHKTLLLRALNSRATFYFVYLNEKLAYADIESALQLSSKMKEDFAISSTYSNLGLYHINNGDYQKAIEAHMKAVEIAEKFNYSTGLARGYNNIGNVYIKLKDYSNALHYYQQALKIAKADNMQAGLAHVLGNLGIIYTNLGKIDSAIAILNQSLNIHQAANNPTQVALNYSNLARLYLKQNKFDSAEVYYLKFLQSGKKLNNQQYILSAILSMADMHINLSQFDKALEYTDNYRNAFEQTESKEFKSKYFQIRSDALAATENYEEALKARKIYELWQDSITNIELKTKIEELNLKYQTEQKQKEILAQQVIIARQEHRLNLFLSIATATILFIIMLYFLVRQNQKSRFHKASIAAITNAQEKERERIARDLHDSVGSMLATLKNDLLNQQENSGEIKLLNQINEELRQISHDMMPATLQKFGIAAAIRSELERVKQLQNIEVEFREFGLDNSISKENQLHIYRIVQEAVQNSVKHSHASHITVSLTSADNILNLLIEDNGKGFSTGISSAGHGLNNMIIRAENILNGKLKIDSNSKIGTVINVNIPLQLR